MHIIINIELPLMGEFKTITKFIKGKTTELPIEYKTYSAITLLIFKIIMEWWQELVHGELVGFNRVVGEGDHASVHSHLLKVLQKTLAGEELTVYPLGG